jgi:hypothetical protein
MNKNVEAACQVFSPAHSRHLLDALRAAKLPNGDMAAQAACVKATLVGLNVNEADFPNPFQRGTDGFTAWAKGFDPQDDAGDAPVDAGDAPVAPLDGDPVDPAPVVAAAKAAKDFARMNKSDLDAWAAEQGITLDARKSKANMIADLVAALEAKAPAAD